MKCYLKITRSGPSCSCSPSCRRACIRRRIQSCTWSQFAAKTATFLTYLILTSTNTFYSSQKRQTVRQKDQVKALKCISICKEHFESLKKYHCTAGLQFYKFFFSCFTAYKNKIFSLLVKSSLVKLETSWSVILPPTVSVLWLYCLELLLYYVEYIYSYVKLYVCVMLYLDTFELCCI